MIRFGIVVTARTVVPMTAMTRMTMTKKTKTVTTKNLKILVRSRGSVRWKAWPSFLPVLHFSLCSFFSSCDGHVLATSAA